MIGEDRDTVLDMGRIPDYHARARERRGCHRDFPKERGRADPDPRAEDTASGHAMEPAPKRARAANAPAQCSPSPMATKGRFIPLAPERSRQRATQSYAHGGPGGLSLTRCSIKRRRSTT
jgi:hypothetical protein